MLKCSKKPNKQLVLLEFLEEPVNTNLYTIARNPYSKTEFIPSNIIPIVMKHFFHSSELILAYNDNHAIYKIMIKNLLVSSVKN